MLGYSLRCFRNIDTGTEVWLLFCMSYLLILIYVVGWLIYVINVKILPKDKFGNSGMIRFFSAN